MVMTVMMVMMIMMIMMVMMVMDIFLGWGCVQEVRRPKTFRVLCDQIRLRFVRWVCFVREYWDIWDLLDPFKLWNLWKRSRSDTKKYDVSKCLKMSQTFEEVCLLGCCNKENGGTNARRVAIDTDGHVISCYVMLCHVMSRHECHILDDLDVYHV